ncbi:MAG: hypothetical protein LBP76_03980 [Treponema sp.]|jgi:hypothetical protein|nr:hypothetical protein [Treponema sp.]
MIRVKKGISCETIGELKKAIAGIPDDTRFTTLHDEHKYVIETWKLQKDSDYCTYAEEKLNAEDEGIKPNFMRISITEDAL